MFGSLGFYGVFRTYFRYITFSLFGNFSKYNNDDKNLLGLISDTESMKFFKSKLENFAAGFHKDLNVNSRISEVEERAKCLIEICNDLESAPLRKLILDNTDSGKLCEMFAGWDPYI